MLYETRVKCPVPVSAFPVDYVAAGYYQWYGTMYPVHVHESSASVQREILERSDVAMVHKYNGSTVCVKW